MFEKKIRIANSCAILSTSGLDFFPVVGLGAPTDQSFVHCFISQGLTTDLCTQNASLCFCCSSATVHYDKWGCNCCFVWFGKIL